MDDKIIFKPEKGTASYNPLIDNIEYAFKFWLIGFVIMVIRTI